MKNKLRTFFQISVFCLIFGCAASAFGQIKTGGYKAVSVEDAGVKEAANFAVETKADELQQAIQLEEIMTAERQTVAGTNYRLCLLVSSTTEDDDDITLFIKTVIHKNLKGELKITSWDEDPDECGEK